MIAWWLYISCAEKRNWLEAMMGVFRRKAIMLLQGLLLLLSSVFSKKLKIEKSYNILKTLILIAGLFIPLVLWKRIFPVKVLVAKIFKRRHDFDGMRRFVAFFRRGCCSSVYWSSAHHSSLNLIYTLPWHSHLGLATKLFPSGFPVNNLFCKSPHPYCTGCVCRKYFCLIWFF